MPFQPLGYKKGKQTNEKQQQIKNKITTKHCTVVSSGNYISFWSRYLPNRDKEKQNKTITKRLTNQQTKKITNFRSIFISSYISGWCDRKLYIRIQDCEQTNSGKRNHQEKGSFQLYQSITQYHQAEPSHIWRELGE